MIWIILIGFLGGLGIAGFAGYKKMKTNAKERDEEKEKYIPTTQDQVPIEYIRSGVIKIKSGGYRIIVEMPSINIDLMDYNEKQHILRQYKEILTAVDFPFQILQQSRVVDIKDYLDQLDKTKALEDNLLIEKQLEYYQDFIKKMIKERSILTKKFFFIIPYDEKMELSKTTGYYAEKQKQRMKEQEKKIKEAKKKGIKLENEDENNEMIKEEKSFEKARKVLNGRGNLIMKAFKRFEISPRRLEDKEILDLYYTAYNKERSKIQSLNHVDIDDYLTINVKMSEGEM